MTRPGSGPKRKEFSGRIHYAGGKRVKGEVVAENVEMAHGIRYVLIRLKMVHSINFMRNTTC